MTRREIPHRQMDQQPDDPQVPRLLAEAAFALAGVEEQPSGISVPGARALVLRAGAAAPAAGFLVGREVAHLHPAPDHSLHAVLSPDDVRAVVEAGWGELHPLAGTGAAPDGLVMLYAPRTPAEVAVVVDLLRRSVAPAADPAAGN